MELTSSRYNLEVNLSQHWGCEKALFTKPSSCDTYGQKYNDSTKHYVVAPTSILKLDSC